tara:strand:+ start:141 stop:926 length:786 start_codon:yes stop_codon:yes gene_type:complete
MRRLLFIILFIPIISYSQADQLRAVIIVGDQQDGTINAIEDMENIHTFFKSKNVIVKTFYHPKTSWKDIVRASKDASFFVYSGHGMSWPDGKYGGLDLNEAISSEAIVNDLKLKSNAIVIFKSVCGGAGSSASDDGDIGIKKAIERVSDYSRPFLNIGASAYYANNFGEGCLSFLNDFFEGKTMKECFDNSIGWSAKLEVDQNYRYDRSKSIGVASCDWGGTVTKTSYINGVKSVREVPATKDYDIAYVANSRYNISTLKK